MNLPKLRRIEMATLCAFALSCSAVHAQEPSDKSQREKILALNTQIGDYYCEHKYDRAAKAFEQVLPLLEKVSYFSEGYLATSYLNYSTVLSRLHRMDESNKYAAKARELEAKAKANDLENAKPKPPPTPSFWPQPTPIPPASHYPDALVPPALPATRGAPADIELALYISDLQRRLRRRWFPPAGSEGKMAALQFFVHSSGTVSDIKIEKSAGSGDYDAAMRKTIENAAPFRRIACECPLHFKCTFTGSKQSVPEVELVRTP